MPYVDVKEAVSRAWQRGTALVAVNVVNLETAQGVVLGAERVGRPVILMVSKNAAEYAGLKEIYLLGRILQQKAQVPVYLHFDHAEDLDDLERAYTIGFESAMLEVRHDPRTAQGMALLLEARRLAGKKALEVELEVVEKGERSGSRLREEELLDIAEEVQADWLVVNLGTVHKATELRPLNLERLSQLRRLGRPLVLHGGSSVPLDQLLQAISMGIAKVNLATAAFRAFTLGVRAEVGQTLDPRGYLASGREGLATWLAGLYQTFPPLGS